MKKFLMTTLVVVFLASMQTAVARAPEKDPVIQFVSSPSIDFPTTIDNIEVPYEVVTYVQLKYQGYAVTQAKKMTLSGKPVYRLRVDQDSVPNDYDSFYLLYSFDWKLLGEQKIAPPPKPVKEDKQKPEEKPDEKPKDKPDQDKPEERPARGGEGPPERRDNDDKPGDGRGEDKPDDYDSEDSD